jgi:hypothetical protein
MIEINAITFHPQMGQVKIVLRINGKFLYLRYKDSDQAKVMVKQFEQKGAIIEMDKDKVWAKIDIIKDETLVKFGEEELDMTNTTDKQIENFLGNFYEKKYKEAHFSVERKEIKL